MPRRVSKLYDGPTDFSKPPYSVEGVAAAAGIAELFFAPQRGIPVDATVAAQQAPEAIASPAVGQTSPVTPPKDMAIALPELETLDFIKTGSVSSSVSCPEPQ